MENVHDLKEISEEMSPELRKQAEKLENLVKNDNSMRYPSSWRYPSIPHDGYSKEMARNAIAIASKIFQLVDKELNF